MAEFPKLLKEEARDYLKLTHELIRSVKDTKGEANPLLPLLEEFIWNTGSSELRDNAEVVSKVSFILHFYFYVRKSLQKYLEDGCQITFALFPG